MNENKSQESDDKRTERQPRFDQRERAELAGRNPHEEEGAAPDAPEQHEFEARTPESALGGAGRAGRTRIGGRIGHGHGCLGWM